MLAGLLNAYRSGNVEALTLTLEAQLDSEILRYKTMQEIRPSMFSGLLKQLTPEIDQRKSLERVLAYRREHPSISSEPGIRQNVASVLAEWETEGR